MKVYIAEFRPRDVAKAPLLWKLALDIIGTGYYHTGILIGTRYFEMDLSVGYRELPFKSFEQLVTDRAHPQGDTIDFFEIPVDFTPEQVAVGTAWWEDKIRNKYRFGLGRFFELVLSRPFRALSQWYYRKTGKVLIFARTEAERSMRVCSSAASETVRLMGFDMETELDETIAVPGEVAKLYEVSYRGS